MGAFFEPPPPPPEQPRLRQPEWMGPPENVVGGAFPLVLTLARTGDVAVVVQGGVAYANGFTFTLSVRMRELDDGLGHGPLHWHMRGRAFDDKVLRFGIRFPDGSKSTTFDTGWHGQRPNAPLLMQRGGGGGGHVWDQHFWVWPLPPAGAFAFVCEWPAYGVELTELDIDTAPIRDAAAHAETLWPDDDGPSGGGSSMSVRQLD